MTWPTRTCGSCSGTGTVPRRPLTYSARANGGAMRGIGGLYATAPRVVETYLRPGVCSRCGGAGWVLTANNNAS